MDVIQTSNRQVDKFGAGRHGFQAGVPGVSLATALSPTWCDGVQQELINVLVEGGLAPSSAVLTQVRDSLRRLFGGNVRTVTSGAGNLSADDAGDVYVDASGGAVTLNLPATDAANARPMPFRFFRTDASANAVTINRAGVNTIFNGVSGATSLSLRSSEELHLRSNGGNGAAGVWRVVNGAFARSLAGNGWQMLPSGLIIQWGSLSMAQATTSTTSDVTLPLAFPNAFFTAFAGGNNIPFSVSATPFVFAAMLNLSTIRLQHYYTASGVNVSWLAIGR